MLQPVRGHPRPEIGLLYLVTHHDHDVDEDGWMVVGGRNPRAAPSRGDELSCDACSAG